MSGSLVTACHGGAVKTSLGSSKDANLFTWHLLKTPAIPPHLLLGLFAPCMVFLVVSQSILVWVSFLRLSMAELAWNLDYFIQEGYTCRQDCSHRLPRSILSGHPGYCHCPGKEKETLHVSYLDSFIFLRV